MNQLMNWKSGISVSRLLRLAVFTLLIVVVSLPLAAQQQEEEDEGPVTIADIVVQAANDPEAPQFTLLLAALQAADPVYLELLSNEEAFVTVFAPTDEAFNATLQSLELSAEELLADTEQLNNILAYHVVGLEFSAEAVISYTGALMGTMRPNSAVEILADPESGIYLDDARMLRPDVVLDNGVVHIIDAVLLPPDVAPLPADDEESEEEEATLADIILASANLSEDAEFTIMQAAIRAADPLIFQVLTGEIGYDFTLFVPTDAAFASALAELNLTVEQLTNDPYAATLILAYHLMVGRIDSQGLAYYGAQTEDEIVFFATLFPGGLLRYRAADMTINENALLRSDIQASNGVIHVIDGLLMPDLESIGLSIGG